MYNDLGEYSPTENFSVSSSPWQDLSLIYMLHYSAIQYDVLKKKKNQPKQTQKVPDHTTKLRKSKLLLAGQYSDVEETRIPETSFWEQRSQRNLSYFGSFQMKLFIFMI